MIITLEKLPLLQGRLLATLGKHPYLRWMELRMEYMDFSEEAIERHLHQLRRKNLVEPGIALSVRVWKITDMGKALLADGQVAQNQDKERTDGGHKFNPDKFLDDLEQYFSQQAKTDKRHSKHYLEVVEDTRKMRDLMEANCGL